MLSLPPFLFFFLFLPPFPFSPLPSHLKNKWIHRPLIWVKGTFWDPITLTDLQTWWYNVSSLEGWAYVRVEWDHVWKWEGSCIDAGGSAGLLLLRDSLWYTPRPRTTIYNHASVPTPPPSGSLARCEKPHLKRVYSTWNRVGWCLECNLFHMVPVYHYTLASTL